MSPKYGQIAEKTADGAFLLGASALPAGWDADAEFDRALLGQLDSDAHRSRKIDLLGGWLLIVGNVVAAILVCVDAINLWVAAGLAVALLFAPDLLRAQLAKGTRTRASALDEVRGLQPFLDHCGAPLTALTRAQQVDSYGRLLRDGETDLGGARRIRLDGEGPSRRLLTLTGPAAQADAAAA